MSNKDEKNNIEDKLKESIYEKMAWFWKHVDTYEPNLKDIELEERTLRNHSFRYNFSKE